MKRDKNKHNRKSIRLKGYDYSQEGLYFVTVCCQNKVCYLGEIKDGVMHCNDAGKMVEKEWIKLPERFPTIVLHEYQIMPNHFHGIVELTHLNKPSQIPFDQNLSRKIDPDETGKNPIFGDIIGAFKSIASVEYIKGVKNLAWKPFQGKLFQRNFWEHIIRTEKAYLHISNYIVENPRNWKGDKFFTDE